MKSCKRIAALGLAGIMMCMVSLPCMAAVEKPEDMDEATWLRLQDNVLEYDEIEDLVENYNPAYRQIIEQSEQSAKPYEDAAKELRDAAKDMASDAEDIKDDSSSAMVYMIMQKTIKGYRQAADSFDRAVDTVHTTVRRSGADQLKKGTVSGVQQMMIGYYQAMASKEIVDTAVELAQAAYDSSITQQTLGMATSTDVQAAEKALQSAIGQQKVLGDSMTSLRQQMCLMTGWAYDADMQLGEVPEPDLSRIDAMNPDNDLTKAIGNNFTLINLRSESGKGDANRSAKFRKIDEAEAKVKLVLESSYQEILENRTAYEAAATALQSAQITMNGNDLKYQMGMIGRLEYLQLKMAYLQQKAAAETAALDLTQSMENYDWAVAGLADVS